MNQRLKSVDIVKGLGIIFLLIVHSIGIPVFGRLVGAFYMPLFYYLSGYTSRASFTGGYKEYYINKLKYILLTYLKYSVLLLLFYIIWCACDGSFEWPVLLNKTIGIIYSRNRAYMGSNLILLDTDKVTNGPLWFLTSYITSMGLFLCFRKLYEKYEIIHKERFFTAIFVASMIMIGMGANYLPILLPWSLDTVPVCALFMIAGWRMRETKFVERINIWQGLLIAVLFAAVAVINGTANLSIRIYGEHGALSVILFIISGITGSIILHRVCMLLCDLRINNLISVIGQHSLIVLGFHLFVFKCFNQLTKGLAMNLPLTYLLIAMQIIIALFVLVGIGVLAQRTRSHGRM